MAKRLGHYLNLHTLYAQTRPFGCNLLLASDDGESGFNLFMIETSGDCKGYKACSSGKGVQTVKGYLQKMDLKKSVEENMEKVVEAIAAAHIEFKDKSYEI